VFRQNKRFFIIPLILILLTILVVPPSTLVHFKSNLLSIIRSPLSFGYRIYVSLLHAGKIFTFYSEYDSMRNELARLHRAENDFTEEKLENRRLRELLELKQRGDINFTVAQVIGKEPTNWLNSIIIDKGTRDGLFINQPVMHGSGLIGKVIEVAPNTAKILLISDVNSRVVAAVQRTRMEALLEGMGQGLCRLKYIPLDADVELGDVIVSAGGGGVYPKGVAIGKVESVRIDRGGIYKVCVVKPITPLSGLEEVLCIRSNLKPESL